MRGRAYVSPYRANAKTRPPLMMSDATMLRGLSEYIAARRSRSATPALGELMITIGWPAALRYMRSPGRDQLRYGPKDDRQLTDRIPFAILKT